VVEDYHRERSAALKHHDWAAEELLHG
jgi:hypothetical protein